MCGCSVELDLSAFFTDIRKLSCIYLDFNQCKIIRDVEIHIQNLFKITEEICLVKTQLTSDDVFYFPKDENVRLLHSIHSTVRAKVLPLTYVDYNDRDTIELHSIKEESINGVSNESLYDVNVEDIVDDEMNNDNMEVYEIANNCNSKRNIGIQIGSNYLKAMQSSAVQCSSDSFSSNASDNAFSVLRNENNFCKSVSHNSNSDHTRKVKIKNVNCYTNSNSEEDYSFGEKILKNKNSFVSCNLTENVTSVQCEISDDGSELLVNKNNNGKIEKKKKCKQFKFGLNNSNCIESSDKLANHNKNSNFENELITKELYSIGEEIPEKKKKNDCDSSKLTINVTSLQCEKDYNNTYSDESELVANKNYKGEIEQKGNYKKHKFGLQKCKYIECNDKITNLGKSSNCEEEEPNLSEIKVSKKKNSCASYKMTDENGIETYDSVNNINYCDSLNAMKESLLSEIDEKIVEEYEKSLQVVNNVQVDHVERPINSDHCYVSNGIETQDVEVSDQSFTNKRKRKRKHNKKAKQAKKLEAAAKLLDITKCNLTPVSFPRSKTHKFFSDDVNENSKCESINANVLQDNSDVLNTDSEVSQANDEDTDIKDTKKSTDVETNNDPSNRRTYETPETKWDKMTNKEFCNQGVITLLNQAKAANRPLVFEYKKPTEAKTNTSNTASQANGGIKFVFQSQQNQVGENNARQVSNKPQATDVTNRISILKNPVVGQIIQFKILRLGENYQPEVSKEIKARIVSVPYDSSSPKAVTLNILRGVEEFTIPDGKFTVDNEEKTDGNEILAWNDLIEPRLCYQ